MENNSSSSSSSSSSSRSPSPSPSPSSFSPLPLPISVAARPSSLSPPSLPSSNPVTVASSSPHQILTLALPIQPPLSSSDCWSEGATSSLIDAWGDRYLELARGSLRQKQWQEVADAVSSRDDYSKPPKTDAQCKNRIDTLKKKYKGEKEKSKLGVGVPSWPFFSRLDLLLGPTLKASPAAAAASVPKKQRTNLAVKRKAVSLRDGSSSDSLPPAANGVGGERMREVTRAIVRFGEVYQRVESSKLQQLMEMERQRMEFSRELEEQRMHFFMNTQMELSQMKRNRRAGGGGGGGGNHHRHRHGNQNFGAGLM